MLELLILYTLNKTELTLYSLNKFILRDFDELITPSHGSIHPAVKRLKDKGFLDIRKKISDGGKLYTYYSVNKNFKEYFNRKFLDISPFKNQPADTFLTELKARLMIIDLLDENLISEFKEKSLLKLEYYKNKTEEKINNSYAQWTDLQSTVLNTTVLQIKKLEEIIKNLG